MDYKKELNDKAIEMRNEIMGLEENAYSKYVLLEDAIAIANRLDALVIQKIKDKINAQLQRIIDMDKLDVGDFEAGEVSAFRRILKHINDISV